MWKDKVIRKGVLSGIIASLIVIFFLTPLIELIWNLIKDSSQFFYKNIVDSIYTNAALGKRNWVDVEFALWLYSGLIGTMILMTFYLRKKLSRVITKIEKIKNNESDDNNEPEEPSIETIDGKIKKANILSRSLYFLIFIMALITGYKYFRIYTDLQLNTSFEQRLNAVAPLISNQEEEELISKWALMKNRIDYEEINEIFEEYEVKYDIELPEPLMK